MLHLSTTRVAGSWGRDEWRCATYNTKRRRESQEPGSSSITAILETLGVVGGCLGCVILYLCESLVQEMTIVFTYGLQLPEMAENEAQLTVSYTGIARVQPCSRQYTPASTDETISRSYGARSRSR